MTLTNFSTMYNSDGSGDDPPLPSGTQPLHNQVAGHVFGTGKTKLGEYLACENHGDNCCILIDV